MNNQNNNEQNNNQDKPLMQYPGVSAEWSDQDDITRPILENNGAPFLGNVQQDPFLSQVCVDDWEAPIEEISENDGRPTLTTLRDPRRLS